MTRPGSRAIIPPTPPATDETRVLGSIGTHLLTAIIGALTVGVCLLVWPVGAPTHSTIATQTVTVIRPSVTTMPAPTPEPGPTVTVTSIQPGRTITAAGTTRTVTGPTRTATLPASTVTQTVTTTTTITAPSTGETP